MIVSWDLLHAGTVVRVGRFGGEGSWFDERELDVPFRFDCGVALEPDSATKRHGELTFLSNGLSQALYGPFYRSKSEGRSI